MLGGRVFKNELLESAVLRISKTELGYEIKRSDLQFFLACVTIFYNDSFFSETVSTHYVNATHAIRLTADTLHLPKDQRQDYRWAKIDEMNQDETVHSYNKVFLNYLKHWLQDD